MDIAVSLTKSCTNFRWATRLVPKLAPLNTSHADQLAKNIDAKFLEKAAIQVPNSTLSYSQWITLIARHRGLPYFYEWDKSFGGFMRQTYTASQCPLPPVRLQPGYVPPEKFRSHSQVQQDISVLSLTHDKILYRSGGERLPRRLQYLRFGQI